MGSSVYARQLEPWEWRRSHTETVYSGKSRRSRIKFGDHQHFRGRRATEDEPMKGIENELVTQAELREYDVTEEKQFQGVPAVTNARRRKKMQ